MIELSIECESWPIAGTFRISRDARNAAEVVVVTLAEDGYQGRGECAPYAQYGETVTGVVDANEAWSPDLVENLTPRLAELGVDLVEQPLPADRDQALASIEAAVPLCADESCHTAAEVAQLADRYDVVNIKLDKTGGLTEALQLRHQAREAGLGVMVGCMVGTSLAMAPAVLLAQGADFIDLDGPAEARPRPRPALRRQHPAPPRPRALGLSRRDHGVFA